MSEIAIRAATDDDFASVIDFDGMWFGHPWPDNLKGAAWATLELDRFRVAHDGNSLVGIAGIFSQELTVPGNVVVPAGGVTWVAVAPTHRRRGLLRRLMSELHDVIDAYDEPIAMLTASEGGIYERFGYGIASHLRVIEIDRRRTQVRPEFQPTTIDVAMTGSDDPDLSEIFDRYRRQRVGEIRRTEPFDELARLDLGAGAAYAKHADGFAVWKVEAKWNNGHPAHELTLHDLVALTPEAYATLWHTVLSVDLVGPITSFRAMSLDDPLPYLVNDPRGIRTTNLNDMLWLHLRNVRRALAARTYSTEDALVLDVDLGAGVDRWKVDGGPDGASVKKSRSRPDLMMDRASLGAIYLGGVRPSTLARAGRIIARSPDVLRRADAFFAADRLPHCSTGF